MKPGHCWVVIATTVISSGCAGAHMPRIKPVDTFTQPKSFPSGRSAYDNGKILLAHGNPALAIEEFRKEMVTTGRSVRTLNALGVAYAQLGRTDLAEQVLQEAWALDRSAPETAYNFATLNYAQGRYDQAREFSMLAATLARAPTSANGESVVRSSIEKAAAQVSASSNEAIASIARGTPSQSAIEHKRLAVWDLKVSRVSPDLPLSTRMTVPAAVNHAETAVLTSVQKPLVTASPARRAAPAHYSMRSTHIRGAKLKHIGHNGHKLRSSASHSRGEPRLRLVNGVGKSHMASRMANYLDQTGHKAVSLANAHAFDYKYSVIRYSPGYREAALKLAQRLPPGVTVRETKMSRSDIELTLGRDLLQFDKKLAAS